MRLFEGTPLDRPPRCLECGNLEDECTCPSAERHFRPPAEQTAELAVEKRKRGKVVTMVRGLTAADNDLDELLTRLKSACGAGGAIKGDVLEIQGRQLERIREVLAEIGYQVKR